MKLKLLVILLSLLLVISITIIIFLLKDQNFYVSFERSVSPTPQPFLSASQTPTPTTTPVEDEKKEINKKFTIPLTDIEGNVTAELGYTLTDYEMTDDIIVKGQYAKAIKGKKYLIINIKVDNPSTQMIQINSRDYVRLSVNDNDTWLAADIHNDPLEIQAISSKISRLGFVISEMDEDFALQIGDLNGQKEIIRLP